MILLSLLLAAGQVTPVQPIVKGTGLPPAVVTEEAGVMVPIDAMFAALAARDGQALLAQARPEGALRPWKKRPTARASSAGPAGPSSPPV
ncbi:hypothetical protein [Sphingomonas aerolata]|uniref:hypothetical protein n=1 Tax=Sphingomonas aerolata TaxID=185951 RepID=UPI002FDFE383